MYSIFRVLKRMESHIWKSVYGYSPFFHSLTLTQFYTISNLNRGNHCHHSVLPLQIWSQYVLIFRLTTSERTSISVANVVVRIIAALMVPSLFSFFALPFLVAVILLSFPGPYAEGYANPLKRLKLHIKPSFTAQKKLRRPYSTELQFLTLSLIMMLLAKFNIFLFVSQGITMFHIFIPDHDGVRRIHFFQ